MKKLIFLVFCLYLGGVIMSSALDKVEENIFKLRSNDLVNNEIMPMTFTYKGYGCDGENKSPQLSWVNAPSNTQSFAIICHDPDAPRENGWYHWLVVNIPKNVSSIKRGEKIYFALETLTDFGTVGYGGACPPVGHGKHRYNFTVYALNTEKLDVSANSKPLEVEALVKKYAIAKSTITALFER